VLAADATALPDVVGAAGELLPVDQPVAWATAMRGLLGDDDRRSGLVALGRERVKAWAPAASAGMLVEAWERAGSAA
jgi:alpha-1,3-rhamnosyl/mannosyltransferase